MAEDQPHISFAPNRFNGQPVERPLQAWEPPAPVMSPMQVHADIRPSLPFEEEEVPPGVAQVQTESANTRQWYVKLGPYTDEEGHVRSYHPPDVWKQAQKAVNIDVERSRYRTATGNDYIHPLDLVPGPRLTVPPPIDRRTGERG